MSIHVHIYSDLICPWCYIGKRRLESAIASFKKPIDVHVQWLPFQLNPQMPTEGISRVEYRSRKFGTLERSRELDARVAAAGEADGIHFAFDRIERTPNTVDAHRLIWLASKLGVQDAVVEGLFYSYFTEGRDFCDRETLIDVVTNGGLNRHAAESCLNSNDGLDAIHEAAEEIRKRQIEGVPFFLINEEIALSGAQPAEIFMEAFHHALAS